MYWFEVQENLPDEDRIVLAWSSVHQHYYLAKWSAARGWLDQDNDDMKIITHWCDMPLPLQWPIKSECDEQEAKKFNIKVFKSFFYS